jgi:hypothetical protein
LVSNSGKCVLFSISEERQRTNGKDQLTRLLTFCLAAGVVLLGQTLRHLWVVRRCLIASTRYTITLRMSVSCPLLARFTFPRVLFFLLPASDAEGLWWWFRYGFPNPPEEYIGSQEQKDKLKKSYDRKVQYMKEINGPIWSTHRSPLWPSEDVSRIS